jgi:cytochrome c oxidase assembly factor CtaG
MVVSMAEKREWMTVALTVVMLVVRSVGCWAALMAGSTEKMRVGPWVGGMVEWWVACLAGTMVVTMGDQTAVKMDGK